MINKRFTSYLLLLTAFWVSPVQSEKCLVSTDARSLMNQYSELQSEKILAEDERYSAVLKNGDIVLATFANCDLGFSAHYFSVLKLDNALLIKK